MNQFNQLPEFEKEFNTLSKKYRSLPDDLKKLEKLIEINPTGMGTNFVMIHNSDNIKVIKTRLACKSLRDRSIRIIYSYREEELTFMYIEVYFKGDKENENQDRIKQYLKSVV